MTHDSVLKRRARVQAKKNEKARKMEVHLVGGPGHGTTKWISPDTDTLKYGLWTYTYAGKIDNRSYFAIKLKSRAANHAIMKLIQKFGRDPRVQAILGRETPTRAEGGKDARPGNRKRAARRSLAGSAVAHV